MRIVALMTAKGNNTLQGKNMLPVSGHPLIWYPATAASKCELFTEFYASSDSEKILDICAEVGYQKIRRPDSLALPTSQHVDAIKHALDFIQDKDEKPIDIIVVLLGNTVFVKSSWLREAISRLISDSTLDSVTPVYQEQDNHPYRARRLDENGCVVPYFDFSGKNISTNRQDLPANYYFSHNFWAIRLQNGQLPVEGYQPWTFMGKKVSPLIVEEGFDVHTMEDIKRCEEWIKDNNIFD